MSETVEGWDGKPIRVVSGSNSDARKRHEEAHSTPTAVLERAIDEIEAAAIEALKADAPVEIHPQTALNIVYALRARQKIAREWARAAGAASADYHSLRIVFEGWAASQYPSAISTQITNLLALYDETKTSTLKAGL